MSRGHAWLVAVAAQLGFLGWIVAREEYRLAHGDEVELEVRATEEVDASSGRYLKCEPAIAWLDVRSIPLLGVAIPTGDWSAIDLLRGQSVAVELGRWNGATTVTRLVAGGWNASPPFLRATVVRGDHDHVGLDFQLDRYFLAQQAHDPSPLARDPAHRVTIRVRVGVDGSGTIEELRIDGRPFAEWDRARQ